jgi:hypothetical protein
MSLPLPLSFIAAAAEGGREDVIKARSNGVAAAATHGIDRLGYSVCLCLVLETGKLSF